jgi:phosphoribosyl 1,2-cyclic phosphodiesterase
MLERMVRFTVLASGSKGNATVLSGGRTRILVDAGVSCRELFRRMGSVGEDPETLDAILVTHEHSDHVAGISVTARKLGIPVYFTEATHRAWMRWCTPHHRMTYAQWIEKRRELAAAGQDEAESDAEDEPDVESAENLTLDVVAASAEADSACAEAASSRPPTRAHASEKDPSRLPAVEYFQAGEPFAIGDIEVSPFTIPHDAADPCGFVFRTEGVRLAYATDLGYMAPNVKSQLQGVDLLLLESNHDLDMLRDGPYPWQVKQRVLSRVGHLSNDAAASFLEDDYDGQAAYIILGHLSESNNLPELARLAAEQALAGRMSLVANHLLLASQSQPLDPIRF